MNKYTTEKLQKAENVCIIFITGAEVFEHITPHYRNLGLLKLDDRRTISLAAMSWKVLKYQTPQYLYEMFHFSNRHPDRLIIPLHRTAKYANSFCISAIHAFNKFSGFNFLKYENVATFKRNLKSQHFHKY